MDVQLRSMRDSDAMALAALLEQPGARRGTLRLPYRSTEAMAEWVRKRSANGVQLVAERGEELLGFAILTRLTGRRIHVAELFMAVADDEAGKGIGSALLGALVEAADNWLNLRRLELTVYTDNRPALALYEKFGFVREGTQLDYAFREGAYADAHCMARLRR
jgi:putative acetyltransferase